MEGLADITIGHVGTNVYGRYTDKTDSLLSEKGKDFAIFFIGL